jgi:CRP-like cAMP-binding protein
VEVDGQKLAEVGPGVILGERAVLEGGTRTVTLRAVTPVAVAEAPAGDIGSRALAEVSQGHRRAETR